MIISDGIFGRVRWSFISELYELVQCVFTVPATIKVFFNPLAPKFAVTPKGEQLEDGFISSLATPFYFLFVLTVFSMVVGSWRAYLDPQERGVTFIVLGWSLLNLIMVCAALGVVLERKQRRAFPRMPATGSVRIHFEGGNTLEASLDNVSAGGASLCITTLENLPKFQSMIAGKIQFEMLTAYRPAPITFNCVLRNIRPGKDCFYIGLEFAHQSHDELSAKVVLVFGDSDRWLKFQESRASRRGIKRNLWFLVQLGLFAALAHFYVLACDLIKGLQLRTKRGVEICYHFASQIV
jgi:cellulose synthase (UDP-forming)